MGKCSVCVWWGERDRDKQRQTETEKDAETKTQRERVTHSPRSRVQYRNWEIKTPDPSLHLGKPLCP